MSHYLFFVLIFDSLLYNLPDKNEIEKLTALSAQKIVDEVDRWKLTSYIRKNLGAERHMGDILEKEQQKKYAAEIEKEIMEINIHGKDELKFGNLRININNLKEKGNGAFFEYFNYLINEILKLENKFLVFHLVSKLISEYDNENVLLYTAIEKGHEGMVKLLLDDGIKLDFKEKINPMWHTLTEACTQGNVRIVKLLLDAGVYKGLAFDRSPLIRACECGHTEVVKVLLESDLMQK